METPAPVDINKLKTILGNAKKVMKAADEKFPEKKSSKTVTEGINSYTQPSSPVYDERDEREPDYGVDYNNYSTTPIQQRNYTTDDVMNSKLPPIIKEAMLNKPIPKLNMPPSKFSLGDLNELIEKPKVKKPATQLNESSLQKINTGMITISVDELNEMIDKRVNEVIAKMFVKTLTEQTIKKTVNTLIKEGKINGKK